MAGEPLQEHEIFALVGEQGFDRICSAFYRGVRTDEILGPMYPADDMVGAEQRLRDFLIYRFGGPATYIEQRGHPRLRARHSPFAINQTARNRWMELMTAAIEEAEVDERAAELLTNFFDHMATFLINRPGS